MLTYPNAKINLGLFITEKRSDGYHNIETVLMPVPLCDALEVLENRKGSEDVELHVHGRSIDGNPSDNLVCKAYQLLKKDFPTLPNIRVDLLKKIPSGAGLGGGSADAAFMLELLNRKFLLGISDEALEDYARRIGSDCACFVKNRPAFAYEKGDVFEPMDIDLSDYQLVLICPPIHVNTKAAYQHVVPKAAGFDLRKLPETPIHQWKEVLQNDFEPSVFSQHPILSDIKKTLYNAGAAYVSMSGSGSAMFGLFPRETLVKTGHAPSLQKINHFLQIAFEKCTLVCLNL